MAVILKKIYYFLCVLLLLSYFVNFTTDHSSGFFDLPIILTLNMSLSNTLKYVFRISVFSVPLCGNRHVTICTHPAMKLVNIIWSTILNCIDYHKIRKYFDTHYFQYAPNLMSRKDGLSVTLII